MRSHTKIQQQAGYDNFSEISFANNLNEDQIHSLNPILHTDLKLIPIEHKYLGSHIGTQTICETPKPNFHEPSPLSFDAPFDAFISSGSHIENTSRSIPKSEQDKLDYFEAYSLKVTAAGLIAGLAQQADLIFTQKATNRVFEYILNLKALLMLFGQQQIRKDTHVEFEARPEVIEECKNYIHYLYTEVKRKRAKMLCYPQDKLRKAFLEVGLFNAFIEKVLGNPDKTYMLFTLDEIHSLYVAILEKAYKGILIMLKNNKTQTNLRLALWMLMCLKEQRVFSVKEVQNCLQNFWAYGSHLSNRDKNRIDSGRLEDYLATAECHAILGHYKMLKRYLEGPK